MKGKIRQIFDRREKGHPAFIPFMMAGDPDRAQTLNVIAALANAGADLIELGVPFSDPVADGLVIQKAAERALAHHFQLADVLDMVREIRAQGLQTPLLIFSYLNPIYQMGIDVFAKRAKDSGVDGVLVVDLPPEEAKEYCQIMQAHALETVFLASPTTSDARLKLIDQVSTGFVYYVSRAGVTGAQAYLPSDLLGRIDHIRRIIQKPLCVGFGISTRAHARHLKPYVDGIVIGSAIVTLIEGLSHHQTKIGDIQSFFQGLQD